jgi:hypothetical protein
VGAVDQIAVKAAAAEPPGAVGKIPDGLLDSFWFISPDVGYLSGSGMGGARCPTRP